MAIKEEEGEEIDEGLNSKVCLWVLSNSLYGNWVSKIVGNGILNSEGEIWNSQEKIAKLSQVPSSLYERSIVQGRTGGANLLFN